MKIKNLYALLLHSPEQLLEPFGNEIYNALQELKNKNFVKKIGISIYNPDDLDSLLSVGDFDLVQCPMNIIDQRLVNSGWLQKLKSRNIEINTTKKHPIQDFYGIIPFFCSKEYPGDIYKVKSNNAQIQKGFRKSVKKRESL